MTCEGCGSKMYCILRNTIVLPPTIESLDKCRDMCPCQDCLIKSICTIFCDERKHLLNICTKLKCSESIVEELIWKATEKL
jgi:hypothetical protein